MNTRAPVEDRLELQELVAQYAFRCDTKQYTQVADLFTEDGVFDETVVGMPLCESRTAIDALFSSMEHADLYFLFHLNGNHRITAYLGGSASATCHLLMEGRYLGSPIRILGYYTDSYTKLDGQWLSTADDSSRSPHPPASPPPPPCPPSSPPDTSSIVSPCRAASVGPMEPRGSYIATDLRRSGEGLLRKQ